MQFIRNFRYKKTLSLILLLGVLFIACTAEECSDGTTQNKSAKEEQARTEVNQQKLNAKQPPPKLDWSLERDNLIKRFKLQNDRSVMFYMYVFNYGIAQPIGYYQVNKVSSVDSQLTNPMQAIDVGVGKYDWVVVPSPAEDGSYGTNGNGVFGFTPEDVYIEHNMQYMVSTVPLKFPGVPKIVDINVETAEQIKQLMQRLNK